MARASIQLERDLPTRPLRLSGLSFLVGLDHGFTKSDVQKIGEGPVALGLSLLLQVRYPMNEHFRITARSDRDGRYG